MPKGTSTFTPVILDGDRAARVEVIARCKYKFSDDAGAIGDINLFGEAAIPSGAVIIEAGLDVIVAPTSGGAPTVALKIEGAGDLQAAAAISGAPWSTTGRKNLIPQGFATSVKTTAARDVVMTIATATLTAGEFDVYLKYLVPA